MILMIAYMASCVDDENDRKRDDAHIILADLAMTPVTMCVLKPRWAIRTPVQATTRLDPTVN